MSKPIEIYYVDLPSKGLTRSLDGVHRNTIIIITPMDQRFLAQNPAIAAIFATRIDECHKRLGGTVKHWEDQVSGYNYIKFT